MISQKYYLNILLNNTFLSDYRQFPDNYVSQGSDAFEVWWDL